MLFVPVDVFLKIALYVVDEHVNLLKG